MIGFFELFGVGGIVEWMLGNVFNWINRKGNFKLLLSREFEFNFSWSFDADEIMKCILGRCINTIIEEISELIKIKIV